MSIRTYVELATIPHDKVLKVTLTDVPKTHFVPFTLWGKRGTPMDIAVVMHECTQQEGKMLLQILDLHDPKTFIATLPTTATKTESVTRSKTLRSLITKNLIKKVGLRKYFLNPNLLIPQVEYRDYLIDEWERTP